MNVSIVTLGCKVNQCESASVAAALIKRNIKTSEGLVPADVYVLNTCSVTAEADRKSRQYISKMIKLNKDCKIIVVGCSSQNNSDKFKKNNVIAVSGTRNKSAFVLDVITNLLEKHTKYSILSDRIVQNIDNSCKNSQVFDEEYPIFDRTRAFVKIQDGCNRFCSYCIIPYLRGRSVSRGIEDILNECRNTQSQEIVLTGIDVSSYGKDIGVTFADLISALSAIPARKRLSSIECEVIDDTLLIAMQNSGFCPHFHLSLQSGCDSVLKTMNRKYDTKYYYEKIQLIRQYFPLAGITTDIIVGFPAESDEDFNEGLRFIEKCEFSDIHVFPYSSREGTLAAKKYSMLPGDIVSQRVDRMLALKHTSHSSFIKKNLGTNADIYTETLYDGNYNVGYTPNYIKVYSTAQCGTINNLYLTKPIFDGILGK